VGAKSEWRELARFFLPAKIYWHPPLGGVRAQYKRSIRWPDRANSPKSEKKARLNGVALLVLHAPTVCAISKRP